MKKKLVAVIEKGPDEGFAITASVPGLIGSGLTEEEARVDFMEIVEEQAEYYALQHGQKPWWAGAEVEFRYDLAAFFAAFPFINVSQFARSIGVNPSLMRKYKQGIAAAGEKQRAVIQQQLSQLIGRLELVQF
ncbi:MAG: type II toxin-antitoxin system HicB family antitoxin [Paraprevotella sp.]|nr:type II toxin-antitoxin system HicB family antitoxin [Paraprevotella sp.]